MLNIVFNVVIIILFIISIYVDIKRIKAVKENTKIYKDLVERFLKMREDIHLSIKTQKENTISFDELVEEVGKKITENIKRAIDPRSH